MRRTNTDHFRVGINLFGELANYRRYLQTIPAKAGISQSYIANNTKIHRYTPVPHRPFLRKQESPGRQPSGDNGGDNNATFTNNPPSPTDHSCVGRNLTVMCCQ